MFRYVPPRGAVSSMRRSAAALTLTGAALAGLGGCGDPKPVAAKPVTTGPGFSCPVKAPAVAAALRSDATLISKQNQACLYGQATHSTDVQAREAYPKQPSAWIALNGADAVAIRAARQAEPDPPTMTARPDLADTAFEIAETSRKGTRLETTFTDLAGDTWTVVVRIPPDRDAADPIEDARDRSDGIVDAMIRQSMPQTPAG